MLRASLRYLNLVYLACTDGAQCLVVGKSKRPRAFRAGDIPLRDKYYATKKAWMTGALFTEVMKRFDMEFSAGDCAMIIDNAGSHTTDETQSHLHNIKLIPLPPNTTALMQPNDQGIIAAFKAQYRKQMLFRMVRELDAAVERLQGAPIPRDLASKVSSMSEVYLVTDNSR